MSQPKQAPVDINSLGVQDIVYVRKTVEEVR